MNYSRALFAMGLGVLSAAAADRAAAQGYPWRNHAPPYEFRFGNDFDTHQQTRLDRSGALAGFLYVRYTGEVTDDGYPVARHVDCEAMEGCLAGWILRGEPGSATFLYHVEGDHPTWLVRRAEIPQPGSHSHFHFVGPPPVAGDGARAGFFLELQALDRFCFVHHGSGSPSGSCAESGGIAVNPGIDIATHLNIVASFPNQ